MKTIQKTNDRSIKDIDKMVELNFIATARSYFANPTKTLESLNYGENYSSKEFLKSIDTRLNLTFIPEHEIGSVCFANNNTDLRDEFKQVFAPIDILDYIYAIWYSPKYREKDNDLLDAEFLKDSFPKNTSVFWRLVKLGGKLRQLHILENLFNFNTQFLWQGGNEVTNIHFEIITEIIKEDVVIMLDPNPAELKGKVYINDTQYFDYVPFKVWELNISGYKPAQQWLTERLGQILELEEIRYYQKIIVILNETNRLIDKIDIE